LYIWVLLTSTIVVGRVAGHETSMKANVTDKIKGGAPLQVPLGI